MIIIINNPYIYLGLCSSKCFPHLLSCLTFIMTVLGKNARQVLSWDIRSLVQCHMEEMSWLLDGPLGLWLLNWLLVCLIQAGHESGHILKSHSGLGGLRGGQPSQHISKGLVPCLSLVGPRITDPHLDSQCFFVADSACVSEGREYTPFRGDICLSSNYYCFFFNSLQNYFMTSKLTSIEFINLIK